MELRHKYPLIILLKVLQLSKTTYFYQKKQLEKEDKNLEIKKIIKKIYEKHKGRYGYRRITLTLRNENIIVNHKKVKRLMKEMGLYGMTPKAKYKSYKGDMNGTVKNLLLEKIVDEDNHKTYYERHFETTGVNQKWTTDVSEFHIASGKLYLSPILDIHNREIISYSISKSPNYEQTKEMLSGAFKKHPDLKGLIFHSDQGWQYQMRDYHIKLEEKEVIQSMSRKGNCLDNSPMENFFGIMKREMFYGHEYEFHTLDELRIAMEEYIEYIIHKELQLN